MLNNEFEIGDLVQFTSGRIAYLVLDVSDKKSLCLFCLRTFKFIYPTKMFVKSDYRLLENECIWKHK